MEKRSPLLLDVGAPTSSHDGVWRKPHTPRGSGAPGVGAPQEDAADQGLGSGMAGLVVAPRGAGAKPATERWGFVRIKPSPTV